MALAGLADESIVRGPAWRFLDLGRRLERALRLLGLVEAMLVPADRPGGGPARATRPCSPPRRASSPTGAATAATSSSTPLCDLLLVDDTNPRSLAFQLDRLSEDLASLPERRDNRQTRGRIDDASRLVDASRLARTSSGRRRPRRTSVWSSSCSTRGAASWRWPTG